MAHVPAYLLVNVYEGDSTLRQQLPAGDLGADHHLAWSPRVKIAIVGPGKLGSGIGTLWVRMRR